MAAHYAVFDGHIRFEHLPADRAFFVSYRKQNRVFWSSRPHRVKEGELIFTDGEHLARARCGNRLSAIRMFPIDGSGGPAESELDFPELPDMSKDPDGSELAFPISSTFLDSQLLESLAVPSSRAEFDPGLIVNQTGNSRQIPETLRLIEFPQNPSLANRLGTIAQLPVTNSTAAGTAAGHSVTPEPSSAASVALGLGLCFACATYCKKKAETRKRHSAMRGRIPALDSD